MKVKVNLGLDEIKTNRFWRAVLAEFFGTMIFILSMCLVVQQRPGEVDLSARILRIGFGVGLSVTSVGIMIGHISGAHLNPAVSLGLIFGGRLNLLQGLCYMPAQVVGAIVGSALAYGLSPADARNSTSLGVLALGKDVTPAQCFGLELLFTFVLVFFILSITDDQQKLDAYSTIFGIGICVFVCHCFLVPMTGCGLNPARAIGPAVVMNKWKHQWCYWIGPLAAAPLAALLYKFLFFHEVAEVPVKVNLTAVSSYASNNDEVHIYN